MAGNSRGPKAPDAQKDASLAQKIYWCRIRDVIYGTSCKAVDLARFVDLASVRGETL